MAKLILIDEFHLTVTLPAKLAKSTAVQVLRTLNGKRFQTRVRDAIVSVFRRYPSLKHVRLEISR